MTITIPLSPMIGVIILVAAILGMVVYHAASEDIVPLGVISAFFIMALAGFGSWLCR